MTHKSTFFASNKHSSKCKIQKNTYNKQMHLQIPPMLWSPKAPTPQNPLRDLKIIKSRHFTTMHGPITYWDSIRLQMRLYKHICIYKSIWSMLGMRYYFSSLALPFIAHFQLGSYNQYGIFVLLLRTYLIGLLQSHNLLHHKFMTTSNLLLHLQHKRIYNLSNSLMKVFI